MKEDKTNYSVEQSFWANYKDGVPEGIHMIELLSKFKQHLIDSATSKPEEGTEEYSKLHDLAESVIRPQADKLASQSGIRTRWDDQDIEVQYMILGAMIDFAFLVKPETNAVTISEAEIESEAALYRINEFDLDAYYAFQSGAKWMQEQLNSKS